jgi:hypothetical protein
VLLGIETDNKGKKHSKQGYLLLARDFCYMRQGGAAIARGSLSYIFLDLAKRRKRDYFKAPFKFKLIILETCLATSLRLRNGCSIVLLQLSFNYKVDNIIYFKSYLKRKIKLLF